jgi:hypothetical protein
MILEIGYAFVIGLVVTVMLFMVFYSKGPWTNRMASIRVRVDSSRKRYSPPQREEQESNPDVYFFFLMVTLISIIILSRFIYGI